MTNTITPTPHPRNDKYTHLPAYKNFKKCRLHKELQVHPEVLWIMKIKQIIKKIIQDGSINDSPPTLWGGGELIILHPLFVKLSPSLPLPPPPPTPTHHPLAHTHKVDNSLRNLQRDVTNTLLLLVLNGKCIPANLLVVDDSKRWQAYFLGVVGQHSFSNGVDSIHAPETGSGS